MAFTHLHVHSHYSLLDGLAKIDDIVEAAKSNNMSSVALTDHGVMYGIIEFYQKMTAAGLKPILGSEAYIAPNGRHQKRSRLDDKPFHLVLLAQNDIGYRNLLQLTTFAHTEGFYYKPRMDYELLEKYSEGIIALSACLGGEVAKKIREGNDQKIKETIQRYQKIFGEDNFFLELQHNPNIPEQELVNNQIIKLSKTYGAPLVATNDVHYIHTDDAEAQDVLTCIQTKKMVNDPNRLSMVGEDFSFKSEKLMREHFPHALEAIDNTAKIADRCSVEITLGKYHFPNYSPPDNKHPDDFLRELAYKGIREFYDFDPETINTPTKKQKTILERVNYELGVVKNMGFSTYFLIVQDFVNWAKNSGIMVGPGRGSAAGSLVSYLIKITNIDPLDYDLIFERFLNPERISMPDIDIDFADARRDEVIRYVEEKYGKEHVAQIITFGTMAARAAIRDAGRVLGISYAYCDRISKLIPMFTSLDEALSTVTDLKDLYKEEADARTVLDMAKKLEGIARHSSVHACGVLITGKPLNDFVPVQYISQDTKDYVSQYSLHPVEDLGLLKLDFLGLKNLTILETAVNIIKKTTGDIIDVEDLPLDDKKSFALLQRGETTGVFQLESSGMKRYLKELLPSEIDDIIAMVALYRPGPMEFIPDYISGKHGRKKITYLHPKLEPILSKTYGIAIYQEQVLQIARDIAGFSLGEADVLRKAIGKKIEKLLKEQKEKFISMAIKKDVRKEVATQLFEFMEPFAQYGFNKSHAAAYAYIAYQTAYLKANYPAQFMAALLTADQDNTDRISIEVEECKKMNIEVLAPDVNESFATFAVVKESLDTDSPRIRFGLKAVKNVGENIVEVIIKEREDNGSYKSLSDFLERVRTKDLNKKSIEALAKCGALDGFAKRADIMSNIEQVLHFAKTKQRDKAVGQKNMFGMLTDGVDHDELVLAPSDSITQAEELTWEKELLGLYISAHPLEKIQPTMKHAVSAIRSLKPHDIKNRKAKSKILAIIQSIKRIVTRSGKPMLFVVLEDTTASIEALVFPKTLEENSEFWVEDKIVILEGRVNDKDGEKKFIIQTYEEYSPNTEYASQNPSYKPPVFVTISLPAQTPKEELHDLKNVIAAHPGKYRVHLDFGNNGNSRKIITQSSVVFSADFVREVEMLFGKGCVQSSEHD